MVLFLAKGTRAALGCTWARAAYLGGCQLVWERRIDKKGPERPRRAGRAAASRGGFVAISTTLSTGHVI